MSEAIDTPPFHDSVECHNVQIVITNPRDTCRSIEESGFDMVLVDHHYQPGEVPDVICAQLELRPATAEEAKYVYGTVEYLLDSTAKQIGCLRLLYHQLQFFYEPECITYHRLEGCIEITLAGGATAIVEAENIDDDTAVASIHVPVLDGQTIRDDYIDLLGGIEVWGAIQDVISDGKPRGKHISGSTGSPILTINDYHSFLPHPDDYEVWQQLLLYDGWRDYMATPSLPRLAHEEINITHLRETFDVQPDYVVAGALMNIIHRKRTVHKETDIPGDITHIDLFHEFSRWQSSGRQSPDENNHRD